MEEQVDQGLVKHEIDCPNVGKLIAYVQVSLAMNLFITI